MRKEKKNYDYFVTRGNTPNLDLYTKLIGLAYMLSGINIILIAVGYWSVFKDKSAMISLLVLGTLMCILTKLKTTDVRKKARNLSTVKRDIIMFSLVFVGVAYMLTRISATAMWIALIVYAIEMIYLIHIILNYFDR